MRDGDIIQKPYLVTGGAGFIGRHVAQRLLDKGVPVVILDDLSGGFAENLPAGAVFAQGSITDAAFVNALFEKWKFAKVFHLAAYAAENLSHFIKRFNYTNNLIGSVNLINAAVNQDVRCFVFTSSIAVYGAQTPPMHEDMMPHPEDSYGIAKAAVEQELRVSHELFGLNSLIFRPHNVYGPYQNTGDKFRNVLGIFLAQLLRGEPLTVFGDGEQTRAFSHIDDVAPLMIEAAENPAVYNQIFNLGSDEFHSVNRLAALIQAAFGSNAPIRHLDARQEVKHAYCSHEKAKRLLGYRPRVSLEEGVAQMVEWVKKTGVRPAKQAVEIEVRKNMPAAWAS